MMRVLVVEDIQESRRWLCDALRLAFGDCDIEEAADVRTALGAISNESYALALIDIGLPDGSGLEILRALRAQGKAPLCIVTTVLGDDAHIVAALSAGAEGYLLKEQPTEVFTSQLKQIMTGVPALAPSVARRIMDHFRLTGPSAEPSETLTDREKEVLSLIGRGLRNAEVARTLHLSENTVAGYIKDIYRKLGISNRAEASWHALRLGLSGSRD